MSNVRRRMRFLPLLFLALAPSLVFASEVRLTLVNGTDTDITVESPDDKAQTEVLPKESKVVAFRHLQWLRFGQEAYKYNIGPIERAAKHSPNLLVVQAHTDGRLYLVPPGTPAPTLVPPPQPKGFPIKPTRKVDLI